MKRNALTLLELVTVIAIIGFFTEFSGAPR